MAKFLVVAGQSNSGPLLGWTEWAALHSRMNTENVPNDLTYGVTTEAFTMPDSWPAPWTGPLNMKGLALNHLRYFTYYHPLATGYRQYPHVGTLAGTGHTSTRLFVTQKFPIDASPNFSITRRKDGVVYAVTAVDHTALPSGAQSALTVVGFTAPITGEEFDYEINVEATAATDRANLSIHFTSALNTSGTIKGLKIARGAELRTVISWDDATRLAIFDSAFSALVVNDKLVLCPRSVTTGTPTIASSKAAFAVWGYWLPLCFYGRVAGGTYGRVSPFPPGFDYPTFFPSMPYDQSFSPSDPVFGLASAIHLGVAEAMSEYFGDTVYVVKTNFGGSALARTVGTLAFPPSGWFDPGQYSYWAPGGKPNTCYGRWSEEMQHAVSGLPVGVTLDLIGIMFIQGEADSGDEHGVRQYWDNLRALKAAMRARLKALGVWTKDAAKIPWIHPKLHANADSVQERWNDQLSLATIEDPHMRTFAVQDIPVDIETHYTGAGQTTMEYRFRDAFIELFASTDTSGEIDICNLALAHIGDSAKITSLDPLDGSAQATHCARFYPIARDALLETRQWSFALKRATLQALLAEDSDATEWDYAYMHPNDVLSILSVQPDDATDDYVQPSLPVGFPVSTISQGTSSFSNVSAPYSVEVDSRGRKVIYTDLESASIRYVAKVTDTRRYPQTFRLALSWKLASMLAGPIIKGEAGAMESKRCLQMMMAHLGPAESKDAQQSKADVPHVPPWIAARG